MSRITRIAVTLMFSLLGVLPGHVVFAQGGAKSKSNSRSPSVSNRSAPASRAPASRAPASRAPA
ncbi:MAG: hypothetical protein MK165_21380, partial [Pirellulaceae bacterium]|nr:hypothetical protein [Pirellulaceae bacterium]